MSLYGKNMCYEHGLLANISQLDEFYSGYDFVVHVERGRAITPEPKKLGCVVIEHAPSLGSSGMFWRFLTFHTKYGYDVVCSRDADSIFTEGERLAHTAFIDSGCAAHLMFDHPNHRGVMGGMFSILPKLVKFLFDLMEQHINGTAVYGEDEGFLLSHFYPLIKGDVLIPSSNNNIPNSVPFPPHNQSIFIGQQVFR